MRRLQRRCRKNKRFSYNWLGGILGGEPWLRVLSWGNLADEAMERYSEIAGGVAGAEA
jgi:hypothetical protein